MIEAVVALAIIIVAVQMVFSIYQVRYYDKFIRSLVKKYAQNQGYALNTETAKSLFKQVMAVVVVDENNEIVEAHEFKGNTIFSKFQPIKELEGRQINEDLIRDFEKEKMTLTDQALVKIFKKI